MIIGVLLVACQPETVETVKEVEVTRVVTETVVEEGETGRGDACGYRGPRSCGNPRNGRSDDGQNR